MAKLDHTEVNSRVLNTVTVNREHVEWYAPVMKAWQKAFGAKPTPQMLTAATLLTNKFQRPGIECLHIAMCMRAEGCTVLQYTNAGIAGMGKVVGPANNKRKALVAAKVFAETVEGKPFAFRLTFTQNGEKLLAGMFTAIAADKPGKPAKAPKKAKAVKVTPQQNAATEAPQAADVAPETEAERTARFDAEAEYIAGLENHHDL